MPAPTNLEEALTALNDLLCQEDRDYMLKHSTEPVDKVAIQLHHTLGQHLRNEWDLWHNSPLAQFITETHQVAHPDDMSHFIIVTYCQRFIRTRFERIE